MEAAKPGTVPVPSGTGLVICNNGATVLRTILDALLRQTHRPNEIDVFAESTSYDPAAVAASDGLPLRVVRQANGGAASARRRGVKEVTTDIIVFSDPGNVSLTCRVEVLLSALSTNPDRVAANGMTWVTSRDEPTRLKLTEVPLDGTVTVVHDALNRLLGHCCHLPMARLSPSGVKPRSKALGSIPLSRCQ
jgi:hypothetical protein